MPLVIADRVRETSTTTGTGTLTLDGAVTGFRTFGSAIGDGNTCYYTITLGADWEVGLGTVGTGTLARTTVLKSSNSNSAVNFGAGTKDVFVTYTAEKSVHKDASGNVNALGTISSGVWNGTEITVPYGGTGVATLTGIVKGNGTSAFSAAVAGTDYVTPTGTETLTNKTIAFGSNTLTNVASTNTSQTFTAAKTFQAANAIRSEAASTQDAIVIAGRAGGTSSYASTITPTTLSANRTVTIPDETFTIGYRNIPAVGTKTGSYTLAVGDVGKYVQLGSGGSITIPDATFAEGDVISIFNNTTGNITITCSITTAYIAGADSDKATMTLATRGVATVLFISSTVCVVSGNVT
jgi:hypothetical protein